MPPISIIIITLNEADVISRCINSARRISDDIILVDNGSTDNTLRIAALSSCRIIERPWDGYGANKNKGIDLARYDWILSIDADEAPDEELIKSLHNVELNDPAAVYDIKFRSYFGSKLIHFGSWGRDHHVRLFNRRSARWSETIVHETLVMPEQVSVKKLKGYVHHYSVKNLAEYNLKCRYYAKLSAGQYFHEGKSAGFVKLYLSPLFGFIKNYVFRLGFLDGREGWQIAMAMLQNTHRKYRLLNQMELLRHKKQARKDQFAVEYSAQRT
ncbi:MAG TPA: glycosyltransferase family 2 protein [Mucilaginibacter sp.]|jgi:glycosyltransferase involved in cell wall biosynthesis|nr:glycosyltransferase family 2 protein [Mucilaginibacter sp.]